MHFVSNDCGVFKYKKRAFLQSRVLMQDLQARCVFFDSCLPMYVEAVHNFYLS